MDRRGTPAPGPLDPRRDRPPDPTHQGSSGHRCCLISTKVGLPLAKGCGIAHREATASELRPPPVGHGRLRGGPGK